MKTMKRYNNIYVILLLTLLMGGCQSDGSFDNKLYIKSAAKTGEILFTAGEADQEKVLQAELAMPAEQDIKITYRVDESLVKTYNEAYYDNAEMLPAETTSGLKREL